MNIKFVASLSFALILLTFYFTDNVYSQEAPPIGYGTRCLEITGFYPPSCPGEQKEKCLRTPPSEYPDPSKKDHTLRLEGKNFPENVPIYIVGCLTSENNYVCTGGTGNIPGKLEESKRINEKIRRLGFSVMDNPKVQGDEYYFVALENPVSPDEGKITVVARSYIQNLAEHRFFGVYPLKGEKLPRDKTVQYGDLVFTQDPRECAVIAWDPQGRVFDAKTLNPLEGVRVKILDEFGNELPSRPGFTPEVITAPDGFFSFFVGEGRYILKVDKPGYSFPVDLSEVNPQYSKIYGCDPEVGVDLYNDSYVIEEKGKLIKCDVPMLPSDGGGSISDVVIFDFGSVRLPTGDIEYRARFSHPYTLGILKTRRSKRVVAQARADKTGRWKVVISKKDVPQNEALELEGKKARIFYAKDKFSLYQLVRKVKSFINNTISKARAQSSYLYRKKVVFEPIFPYLEGYAYDDKGNIISNAEVSIVALSTGDVLLTLRADENGFFRVPPKYLPMFSYYIRVKPPSGTKIYSYTPSQFVEKNKEYFLKEGVDLFEIKKKGKPIVFTREELLEIERSILAEEKPEKNTREIQEPTPFVKEEPTNEVENQKKLLWAYVAILVIFLTATGLVLIYYIRSRKSQLS